MKMMRKSLVTQAVSAAVFAAGLSMAMTAPVQAAPTYNPHGVGQVLLYPYYTTQNDFSTLFHLVNTSSDKTVIAKIRLRENKDSDDVLDFTVIMSPRDVFTGYIKQGANGPVFVKTDNTCTSPNVGGKNAQISFGSTNLSTSHTGHIEVITMGVIDNAAVAGLASTDANYPAKVVADGALHSSAGVPANCAAVDSYFNATNIAKLQRAVNPATSGLSPVAIEDYLTGHYSLLNAKNGFSGGGRPMAIADATPTVVNPCAPTLPANVTLTTGYLHDDLVCGQYSGHYFVPNLGNLNGIDGTAYNTLNASKLAELELAMAGGLASGTNPVIHNEWSANAANGVSTEMVFTLPLKHIYKDTTAVSAAGTTTATVFANGDTVGYDQNGDGIVLGSELAAVSLWDDVDRAVRTSANHIFNDTTGCVKYSRDLVDREEANTTPGTSASGPLAASIGSSICNETTVFTFGGGVTKPADASAAVDTSGLAQQYGWFKMTLLPQKSTGILSQSIANTGFGFWQRNFGDATLNYGHIIDNTRQ